MINLNNYAILAEQKKYGYLVTESIDSVNEAAPDMQTEDGVKKVLGGKTDPNYVNQWNQLVDDVATRKAAGTYTVTINHDDNRPMVTLQYQIGSDLKPVKGSVKLAAATAAPATAAKTYTDEELKPTVDILVDDLDGIVTIANLNSIKTNLTKYVGQFGLADDDTTKVTAIGRILTLYKRDESGDTLTGDIASVGTATLGVDAEKLKTQLATLLKPYKEQ
jgi:hypothetical protein